MWRRATHRDRLTPGRPSARKFQWFFRKPSRYAVAAARFTSDGLTIPTVTGPIHTSASF